MATAQEYATWIVQNKDLQGTPEFETVAKAYEVKKQSENLATTTAQLAPKPKEAGIVEKEHAIGTIGQPIPTRPAHEEGLITLWSPFELGIGTPAHPYKHIVIDGAATGPSQLCAARIAACGNVGHEAATGTDGGCCIGLQGPWTATAVIVIRHAAAEGGTEVMIKQDAAACWFLWPRC